MMKKGGNEKVRRIAELYQNYRHRIWYLANANLQNESDAEDVVQEVFLFLLQNKEKLDEVPESEMLRFLFALVKRLCEEREGSGRENVFSYGIKNVYEMNVGSGITTERIVIGREMLNSVQVCFERLPEGSQELLRQRLANKSRSAEMAERLHISENTVDARVSRVRKKLKKLWMKEGKWNA